MIWKLTSRISYNTLTALLSHTTHIYIIYNNCALLITVQKAAPLMLISYLIEINALTLRIILISTIVGSIGGLNQTSIRKIPTYTSINHTGWILIALTTSENLWLVCFTIYLTLALTVVSAIKLSGASFINQTIITNKEATLIKLIIFTSLLSLGGLPPFLRFLPKWIVIQAIITNNIYIYIYIPAIYAI